MLLEPFVSHLTHEEDLDFYFTLHTKLTSKFIVDLNVKSKITKLLEENLGKKICMSLSQAIIS